MKNITQFYHNLKNTFPKINQCKFWDEYYLSDNLYENSLIMTEIAREVNTWSIKSEFQEFTKFFEIIENGYTEYDVTTSSFLTTDFLVTIIENEDKNIRDEIKKFMKNKTQEKYNEMLIFYNEI